jgi:hypothetical protein
MTEPDPDRDMHSMTTNDPADPQGALPSFLIHEAHSITDAAAAGLAATESGNVAVILTDQHTGQHVTALTTPDHTDMLATAHTALPSGYQIDARIFHAFRLGWPWEWVPEADPAAWEVPSWVG